MTQDDYSEVFKLSEYAFQYKLDKEEYEKKCLEADRHKIYGYKINDNLAGKLHMIPLDVFVQGKSFTLGGISSVATWPEYGGQKIAEKLMKQSLLEFKEKNTMLAYLHPFNAGFYRRFGFEFAFDSVTYTIPVEKLNHSWKKAGFIERNPINTIELNQVYEAFITKFNGGIKRDKKWWEQRVLTDDQAEVIIIKDEMDTPQAYLIYKFKNNHFEVIEMAYTDQIYLESIYHFILKHKATIKNVEIPTYEGDLLSYILNDPIFTQEKQPYFMARIVDLLSFLKEYPFEFKKGLFIKLFIEDEFLTSNTSFYEVSAKGIIKTDRVNDKKYLTINIGDLTALLMGYKNIKELKTLNKIRGNEEEIAKLDSILNPQPTYLLDFF